MTSTFLLRIRKVREIEEDDSSLIELKNYGEGKTERKTVYMV